MFKKIELWVVFLILLAFLVCTIFFGALIRHEYQGGNKYPELRKIAVFVASIPSNIRNTRIRIKDKGIVIENLIDKPPIENKNLSKISNEIQGSQQLNSQQKTILVGFVNKTSQLIPLLTNENLMEMDTKIKIKEMTDELRLLSSNFKKKDYPFETPDEKSARNAISDRKNAE